MAVVQHGRTYSCGMHRRAAYDWFVLTSDLLCDGLQGDEANAPGPSLLISYVCSEIIHVCCVVLLLQGNKVPLHRDHNWDIFGILLEDHEVCAAV